MKKVLVVSALAVLGLLGLRLVSARPESTPPSVLVDTPTQIAQPGVIESAPAAPTPSVKMDAVLAPQLPEKPERIILQQRLDGGSTSPARLQLAAPVERRPSESQQLMALPQDGGSGP